MEFIFILSIVSALLTLFFALFYLGKGRIANYTTVYRFLGIWQVVVLPGIFLFNFDVGLENTCCSQTAVFSPEHSIGIYVLIALCMYAYALALAIPRMLPPLAEVGVNLMLVFGIVFNVLLGIHLLEEWTLVAFFLGNIPIILLMMMQLAERQKSIYRYLQENEVKSKTLFGKLALGLLRLKPSRRNPFLFVLFAPFLSVFSLFLLLFGQKPNSLILAFTQTYYHNFSQLDYLCANVHCGGHFLCSVGANGHRKVVRPERYGERGGNPIICTRQLLVSNAFEELVQERFPIFHRKLRKYYNRVGDKVHKHYHFFEVKWVSDMVYFLMKPLEVLFLILLYSCDLRPEDRIARQYVSEEIREKIKMLTRR